MSSCVHLANSYDILFRQEQLSLSEYAIVPSYDNRNLRKYFIYLILKFTNVLNTATLQKFIYIVCAAPKRFFVAAT